MCFPNCNKCISDPTPLIDEEGGMIEEDTDLHLPEGLHEHIDSVYLNFDFEDSILAFVYENGNGIIVVWTSPEAEQFGQLCSALESKSFRQYVSMKFTLTVGIVHKFRSCA